MGLLPVTPEVASSSLVDPATFLSEGLRPSDFLTRSLAQTVAHDPVADVSDSFRSVRVSSLAAPRSRCRGFALKTPGHPHSRLPSLTTMSLRTIVATSYVTPSRSPPTLMLRKSGIGRTNRLAAWT